MTDRKPRRNAQENKPRMKKSAKKQLVIMIISIVLMMFSVAQVYHLARYTLGIDVPQEKLKVYRWVYLLLEGNNVTK